MTQKKQNEHSRGQILYEYKIKKNKSLFDQGMLFVFLSIAFLSVIGSYISVAMAENKSNTLISDLRRTVDNGRNIDFFPGNH